MRQKMLDANASDSEPNSTSSMTPAASSTSSSSSSTWCSAMRTGIPNSPATSATSRCSRIAAELGLIDPAQGKAAGDAYREYRRRQHLKRLSATPKGREPREEVERQIAAVDLLWRAVFGEAAR